MTRTDDLGRYVVAALAVVYVVAWWSFAAPAPTSARAPARAAVPERPRARATVAPAARPALAGSAPPRAAPPVRVVKRRARRIRTRSS